MVANTDVSPDFRRDFERVAPDIVRRAAEFQAAILADVAGRRGTLNGQIAALSHDMKVAGPALTIEVRPGDNLMIHAAMAIAKPGDVLVIDGKGDRTCALMGAIMINQCKAIGIAGVVMDGAARDLDELLQLGVPVFSVGTNPNGPTKLVPGRVNWPISLGGIAVNPGDLIVGDGDGVVVIERERAGALLDLAAQKVRDEAKRIEGIRKREQLTPAWLESALRAAGVLKAGEML
jgi:4-hydroxy-4-methyl-2-oxoglutarate aldolase